MWVVTAQMVDVYYSQYALNAPFPECGIGFTDTGCKVQRQASVASCRDMRVAGRREDQ